jgi:glycosyltransferase involved in cell wall biosynthesis
MHEENNKPIVSVIIPVFNRGYLVGKAFESIFSQTFLPWEIIAVDDGSVDNTWQVLNEYAEKNKKIKIFQHKENKGISGARNTALLYAQGEYIAFLDSDDVWEKDKLAKQIDVFNKSKENLGVVYTGAIFINKNITRIKKTKEKGDLYLSELKYNPIGGPSRVMIKKECLDNCGFFDENFKALEDWDLWIRISKRYLVDFIDEPLVKYFEMDDSVSLNSDKLINGYKKLWDKYNILNMNKNIVSNHYLRLGNRLFLCGDSKMGEFYIKKALKTNFSLKNLFIFLLTFFGVNFYKKITFLLVKYIQ